MAWICFAVAVVWAGSCRSDFTSSLGNSICHWCGRKKKKKAISSKGSPKIALKKYYNIPMPVIVITGAGNNIENMLRIVVIVAKGFLL